MFRNLDEAPQSTNQSHQANETVHPINTNPAPGSAERGSVCLGWHPDGGGAEFICRFACLSVYFVAVEEERDAQECAVGFSSMLLYP